MNKLKRMLALVTALALAVTALSGLTVSAAGYQETDAYVLNFSDQAIEGYADYDSKRLYASPYRTDIYVTEDGGLSNWNWCSGSVLNMINTAKLAEGGQGAYASIGVYCVDAVTDGVPGYSYRRVNLEDSSYFPETTAGRLRSIILASFPHQQDMAALAAQVNAWDDANGNRYADVAELNPSEAISATQSVIWTLTNDGKLGSPVYAGYDPKGFPDEQIVYPESMDYTVSDYTENNINALAAYLNALAPTAPRDPVVTDAAFGDASLAYAKAEDGSYTATVKATVTASLDAGDDLTVTALCGGKVSEGQALKDGTNAYTFIFEGLTGEEAFTVNIDGWQDASDVFFFDPLNGREASQSMAGYDSSSLPVHAETTLAPRILNLDKVGKVTTVMKNEDGTETEQVRDVPLANIGFEIYFVGTMEDFVNGRIALENAPQVSAGELEAYVNGKTPIAAVTTGEDGKASYHFTLNGQPDGIYIVKELHNPQTVAPMEPFYISVPMTDGDGNVTTTLNIAPKNDVIEEDVEIGKDVTDIGNDHDTYDVGQVHTWIIRTSIPSGMAQGLKYEITDTLNYQLTYVGNVRVALAEPDAPAGADLAVLAEGEDYTLTVTPGTDENGEEITAFLAALTRSGMEKAAAAGTEAEVRVYFDAYIDEDAILGTEIPNQAHLFYENSVGLDFDRDSDFPEVHTGGAAIVKVDTGDAPLAGAVFQVYRDAREGEAGVTVAGIGGNVVPVAFHDDAAMTGEKAYTVTSDDGGRALIYGLAYGTYYLVETEAPAGYNLLTEPVVLTVDAASHTQGREVTVVNSAKFTLPETGGAGTAMFLAVGAVIIAGGLALLVPKKKKA